MPADNSVFITTKQSSSSHTDTQLT